MADIEIVTHQMDSDERITLGLLNAVHENEQVSQRSIAKELSIALGLANTYLKKCVKKGYIKVKQAPANRYAYYLTPKGFSEKSRLTAEFFSQSFNLFKYARNEADSLFRLCTTNGWQRVALLGQGDLVEIFAMSKPDTAMSLFHFAFDGAAVLSVPEIAPLGKAVEIANVDAVIVCDMNDPLSYHKTASKFLSKERILAPRFLGLNKVAGTSNEGLRA